MSGDGSFVDQFIDDYFAEADEHLATARRVLLGLEASATQPAAGPPLLRELFRSLHTLKGLSGMVGDVVAERVAHGLEESLRVAERTGPPLEPRFVDALFAGVELLERCIAARRSGGAAPDPAPVLAELARVSPAAAATIPTDENRRLVTEASPAPEADEIILHFEFGPTPLLNERGIGVDAIRARLRALGTLLDARPRLVEGRVVFDFWVAVPAWLEPESAWAADGLRWTAAASAPEFDGRLADGSASDGHSMLREPRLGNGGDLATRDSGALSGIGVLGSASGGSIVRVEMARLDGVMRLVGDLVVSRTRLDDVLRIASTQGAAAAFDALEETNATMERQLRQLRERVMRIRLVPIGEAFERLRFAVREAIRESRKQVDLVFHGQSTEIDKLVVDRMLEPLLHLVRNAVSHGIEAPEVREAAGKPATGTVTLRALAAGDRICVEVEDDGAGIDLAMVERRARERGLLHPDEGITADHLLDVLCTPGLSTRREADLTSGRGVGMDIVRAAVRGLAGELSVTTEPGRGTRFAIELPLTLMILDALLVDVGGREMAVPQPSLREILQIDTASIVSFENNDVISWRGGTLPVVALSGLFGFPDLGLPKRYVLVVGSETAPLGVLVDRLLGLREIVVLPVVDPFVAVPGISGATELADGRVSLILDAPAVVRLAQERRERRSRRAATVADWSDAPRTPAATPFLSNP